jgi:hypothetical protein
MKRSRQGGEMYAHMNNKRKKKRGVERGLFGFVLFCLFWWHWDLNSGPHTCLAGTLTTLPARK